MAEVIDFPGTSSGDADAETVAVAPEHVEAIKGDHQRQPIMPEQWQCHNIRSTVRYLAGLHWHRARFHGLIWLVMTGGPLAGTGLTEMLSHIR